MADLLRRSTCPRVPVKSAARRSLQHSSVADRAGSATSAGRESTRVKVSHPSKSCAHCGAAFVPKTVAGLYCGPTCRERAKYRRLREDPDKWAASLARIRGRYVPKPPRAARECSIPNCSEPHLARGMCRRHWRRERYSQGLEGGKPKPQAIVGALWKRYGEDRSQARPITLKCQITVGVIPSCPFCGNWVFPVQEIADMDVRDCGACQILYRLNEEEVAWVISETRSTAA